jgi:Raf kinase inhibitor-like YbhB/YbcL family protein
MRITSRAFHDGGAIPNRYTLYGENRIPSLHFEDVPERARSLALIVDDPDAPRGTFNHWIVFNVDPGTKEIEEESIGPGAIQGRNDFGETQYGGPRPPSGEHRYFFRAYALDTMLSLPAGIDRSQLDRAMRGHVLESATLMGRYAH